LQGFPDNWTQYGIFNERPKRKDLLEREKNPDLWAYKTKMVGSITLRQVSDHQRYKCCGNAVTTNVITDIGLGLGL
jgi:site-specific DNA-cytosine methylase